MANLGVVKYAGLRLTLEGGDEFTRQLKDAQHASKLAAGELKLLREQTKFTGQGTKELGDRVKFLSDRYKAQEAELKTNNELLRKAREMHGANSEEVRKLEQKEVQLKTALEKTSNQLDWANQKLEEQQSKLFKAGQSLQDFGEKWTKAGTKMKDVGRSMTRHVTAPIMAGMGLSVKAAMDFESALTGVQKTTNLTGPELDALGESIRNMAKELPSSTTDIAAVAEAAGQLGIEKDNIMDFTKVVIDLANATNIVGEQGAQDMARFANIMGMSQKDFDRFGSTIVDLGNNSATTEAEILDMAMRLAGAGKQAGLSEADVLGMGTALSSLGIRAEAGGSAFSKVMTQMQVAVETNSSQLEDFARVSGMSTQEFVRAWEDDAAGAIESFIVGLGDMDKHGQSATVMLDEMGITELRMADALRRTSGAHTLVSDSIAMANEAWAENSALTEEANLRYGTSESQLLIQKNRLQDVAITVGQQLLPHVVSLVEGIGDLVSKFNDLDPKTQDTIIKLGLVAAALGPVLSLTGNAVHTIGGISSAVGKLLPNLGKGGGLIGLLSGPVGLVALIAAAVGGIALWATNADTLDNNIRDLRSELEKSDKALKTNTDSYQANADEAFLLLNRIQQLSDVENKSAADKKELEAAVRKLNEMYPELALEIDKTTGKLNQEEDAIKALIEQILKRQLIEEYADKLIENQRLRVEAVEAQTKAEEELAAKIKERQEQAEKAGTDTRYGYMLSTDDLKLWHDKVDAAKAIVDDIDEQSEQLKNNINAIDGEISKMTGGILGSHEEIAESSQKTAIKQKDISDKINYDFKQHIKDRTSMNRELQQEQAEHKQKLEDLAKGLRDTLFGVDQETLYTSELTAAQLKENLKQTISDYTEWKNNLTILAGRVSPEMYEQLKDLGPSQGRLIREMVNMSDEELAEYEIIFAERMKMAKNAALDELDPFANEAAGKMRKGGTAIGNEAPNIQREAAKVAVALAAGIKIPQSVIDSLAAQGYKVGQGTINGIIRGMQSREWAVVGEGGRISWSVMNRITRSFDVRSPSRKTYWIGEMLIQGLADGVSDNLRILDHAAEDMAGSTLGAMQAAQDMQLRQAVAKFSSPEVVSRMQVQVQSERPISSTVQVDQLVVREEADIEKVAHALKNLEQRNLRGIGVA